MPFCTLCGAESGRTDYYCSQCGAPQPSLGLVQAPPDGKGHPVTVSISALKDGLRGRRRCSNCDRVLLANGICERCQPAEQEEVRRASAEEGRKRAARWDAIFHGWVGGLLSKTPSNSAPVDTNPRPSSEPKIEETLEGRLRQPDRRARDSELKVSRRSRSAAGFLVILVVMIFGYLANQYSTASNRQAEAEGMKVAPEASMRIREVGYVTESRTETSVFEGETRTRIFIKIPLTNKAYSCGWESGNHSFDLNEGVLFIHNGGEWQDGGDGRAFLISTNRPKRGFGMVSCVDVDDLPDPEQ
jgi:hypothetical protein